MWRMDPILEASSPCHSPPAAAHGVSYLGQLSCRGERASSRTNERTDMSHSLDRLLAIMARLRDPEHGCPWDREQNFSTIAPYTIEEAYEVADAIARHDPDALKDELGDLLFQVVFHARMAEEAGMFAFDDVAGAIADKMERRHPHVFGAAEVASVAAQNEAWEAHKAAERRHQAFGTGRPRALPQCVPPPFPPLFRAR